MAGWQEIEFIPGLVSNVHESATTLTDGTEYIIHVDAHDAYDHHIGTGGGVFTVDVP